MKNHSIDWKSKEEFHDYDSYYFTMEIHSSFNPIL